MSLAAAWVVVGWLCAGAFFGFLSQRLMEACAFAAAAVFVTGYWIA